jgi:hypothetical protein
MGTLGLHTLPPRASPWADDIVLSGLEWYGQYDFTFEGNVERIVFN